MTSEPLPEGSTDQPTDVQPVEASEAAADSAGAIEAEPFLETAEIAPAEPVPRLCHR